MNRDVIETQWPQVREILREKFSNLTDDDIRQINGRYDQLVAKLQQKYGYSREEAEDRIRSWNFDRFAGAPRTTIARDEDLRREREDSDLLKWLLAIAIPLILIATYFLSTASPTPTTTQTPTYNQEQTALSTQADRSISDGIKNAFMTQQNLRTNADNVQVTSNNGVVTLSGTVPSRDARDSFVNTAKNYEGVRQVIDNLQVK